MHGEAYLSEGVFDFGAIVKAEAADEFVADPAAAEGLLESARLEVGAILHGAGLRGIVAKNSGEFAADEIGFRHGVAGFEVFEVVAVARLGAERFAEAIGI